MSSHRTNPRGFTLIELLVVVAIIALLMSILLPTLRNAREQAKQSKCGAALQQIGRGMFSCYTDNREYGPTWDDGAAASYMYTWVDVLFDEDYLSDPKAGLCPNDQRPDDPARDRGLLWNFFFVREMGMGQTPLNGVRTSYALNALLHYNFPQDRWKDPTQQIMAVDGWWCWFGSINAAWLMYPRIYGITPLSTSFPGEHGTMAAWRHGTKFNCATLYMDGHVGIITPRAPTSPQDLLFRTVDTNKSFVWLPAEYACRNYDSTYQYGGYPERILNYDTDPRSPLSGRQRAPEFVYARHSNTGRKVLGPNENFHPYGFPEPLSAYYRTVNRLWRKLPAEPTQRG